MRRRNRTRQCESPEAAKPASRDWFAPAGLLRTFALALTLVGCLGALLPQTAAGLRYSDGHLIHNHPTAATPPVCTHSRTESATGRTRAGAIGSDRSAAGGTGEGAGSTNDASPWAALLRPPALPNAAETGNCLAATRRDTPSNRFDLPTASRGPPRP